MNKTLENGNPYKVIFQNSIEGIIVVNTEGVIIMANPASEKMFLYESGELLSKKIEVLLPKKLSVNHRHFRNEYLINPKPRKMGQGRDLQAMRKDGTEFPIEISLGPTSFNDQLSVIAFITDITTRKQIENALRESEEKLIRYAAELEKRVKMRTEELDTAVKKLKQVNKKLKDQIQVRKQAESEAKKALKKEKMLNEMKSRFVSMASHEFRTPLSTILSSAALLSKYNEIDAVDKRAKHITRIKTNVNNLTGILNDFLSLDKLETGKVQTNPEPIDLIRFSKELLEEMQEIAKEGQKIIFDQSGDFQEAYLDIQLLRNIVFNLVSNAIKYSPEGKAITYDLCLDKKHATIKVSDQGFGISEEDQEHLFERFFRAQNALNIQGTGLGLNIVKKYLELMNGTINFQSKLNKGSVFTVTLPIKQVL